MKNTTWIDICNAAQNVDGKIDSCNDDNLKLSVEKLLDAISQAVEENNNELCEKVIYKS